MTIQELLKNTGNAGVRGEFTITMVGGRVFRTTRIRHPYGDVNVVGFAGAEGEHRVKTDEIASVEPSLDAPPLPAKPI